MNTHPILVTGAGGFIGGQLVNELLAQGHRVRAVDKKPQWQWYQRFPQAENMTLNLEEKEETWVIFTGGAGVIQGVRVLG